MKRRIKKYKLKKEVKGYILMLVFTILNALAVKYTSTTLENAAILFTYNLLLCLSILIITNDKK